MYTDKIKCILLRNLSLEKVYVFMDGNHYQIIAIDKMFIGKSKVEQHKIVYAPIMEFIVKNKIHSVSICAFCPKEWETQRVIYGYQ